MSATLSHDEIISITGYKRPSDQVSELHRQGFYRARRSPTAGVILERAHYESICAGAGPANEPQVRVPRLRA